MPAAIASGTYAIRVLEFTQASPGAIDRTAGVIRGVKIVGRTSRNGRDYSRALRGATGKYEGARVFIGHPKRADLNEDRPFSDWAGVLSNVHERTDGLYGDVTLRKEGRAYREILEAAERFPGHFGLSHVADTKSSGRKVAGFEQIESITEVFSVDIVCEPATTNGLFESAAPIKTVRERELEQRVCESLERRLAESEARNERLQAEQDRRAALEAVDEPTRRRWERVLREHRENKVAHQAYLRKYQKYEVQPAADGSEQHQESAAAHAADVEYEDPRYGTRYEESIRRGRAKMAAIESRVGIAGKSSNVAASDSAYGAAWDQAVERARQKLLNSLGKTGNFGGVPSVIDRAVAQARKQMAGEMAAQIM